MALARIDLNQKAVLFAAPNGGAAVIPCCMPHSWPSQTTVPGQSRQFCDVCAESAFLSVPKTPSIWFTISGESEHDCWMFAIAFLFVRVLCDCFKSCLCVPKTLSALMRWQNRLSWRNDRAAVFIPCSLGLAIQVEEPPWSRECRAPTGIVTL